MGLGFVLILRSVNDSKLFRVCGFFLKVHHCGNHSVEIPSSFVSICVFRCHYVQG